MTSPTCCAISRWRMSSGRRMTASTQKNSRCPPSRIGNRQQVEHAEVDADHRHEVAAATRGRACACCAGRLHDEDRAADVLRRNLALEDLHDAHEQRLDPPDGLLGAHADRRRRARRCSCVEAALDADDVGRRRSPRRRCSCPASPRGVTSIVERLAVALAPSASTGLPAAGADGLRELVPRRRSACRRPR